MIKSKAMPVIAPKAVNGACLLSSMSISPVTLSFHVIYNYREKALYTTANARIITNIESPNSNHMGFVLRDNKLPILAPLIDPRITAKAGNNIISPLYQ